MTDTNEGKMLKKTPAYLKDVKKEKIGTHEQGVPSNILQLKNLTLKCKNNYITTEQEGFLWPLGRVTDLLEPIILTSSKNTTQKTKSEVRGKCHFTSPL